MRKSGIFKTGLVLAALAGCGDNLEEFIEERDRTQVVERLISADSLGDINMDAIRRAVQAEGSKDRIYDTIIHGTPIRFTVQFGYNSVNLMACERGTNEFLWGAGHTSKHYEASAENLSVVLPGRYMNELSNKDCEIFSEREFPEEDNLSQ